MASERKNWIALITIFIAVFFMAKSAAAISIVRGKAWWPEVNSFLYFDCLDDVIGDRLGDPYNLCGGSEKICDGSICGSWGNPLYCAPYLSENVFHFYSAPCSSLVHHVLIDDQGKFSGQAWNYAKGLVSFESTTTPDTAQPNRASLQAHCPLCFSDSNCWACYDETSQNVYGWARSTIDGTWIRLDSATTTPVQLKNWNTTDTEAQLLDGHGIRPGDFIGYASAGTGYIDFNCENSWSGIGSCPNYSVYIGNLQVGPMTAPNWSDEQVCKSGSGALNADLYWYKKSGTSTAYEIVVNDSPSSSTPKCLIGPIYNEANHIVLNKGNCPSLDYGKNYYWWLRLYDEHDVPTPWYQYQTNSIADSDQNIDNNIKTFSTFRHEFPNPAFTWSPTDVIVAAPTDFVSNYMSGTPAPRNLYTPYSFEWWSDGDGDFVTSTTTATTSIFFYTATTSTISLKVTDGDGYSCTIFSGLTANYDLPVWREVKAYQY